jgi:hypothetical protein
VKALVKRLGLQSTIRPRGRPKKAETKDKALANRCVPFVLASVRVKEK